MKQSMNLELLVYYITKNRTLRSLQNILLHLLTWVLKIHCFIHYVK